ncbi:unnamed protein product [Pylaiella littoralis]
MMTSRMIGAAYGSSLLRGRLSMYGTSDTTRWFRFLFHGISEDLSSNVYAVRPGRRRTASSVAAAVTAPQSHACRLAPAGGNGSVPAAAAAAAVVAAASAAALNSCVGGTSTVSECSAAAAADASGEAYEPGHAVGKGIKSEMWKTKHPNLTILETGEDTPVLGLMSVVRNIETEGAHFVSAANRLMRQLLDYAEMGFPNDEEAEFDTPADVRMQARGVLPEGDLNVCAVSLYLENEPCGVFDQELDAAFPSYERGNLRVRGLTRGSAKELPRNLQGKQILLLAPVVAYAQPVLAALERLEQAGVEDGDVTLVSVVISKDALEMLTEEVEEMKVVCAAMDGETRGSDHMVVPGVGDFSRRYFDAKAIVDAEAAAKAEELLAQSRRRWWSWWRR